MRIALSAWRFHLLTVRESMKDQGIKDILCNFKTVAVVGISPKEDRPSYIVASYLKSKGYRIISVRPDGMRFWEKRYTTAFQKFPKESEWRW